MASKEASLKSTWKYFLKTTLWGGLAGGLSMASGEIWFGYRFHDSDYLFPFMGAAILASSVNGLDNIYKLWRSLSVSKAFRRPVYAPVPFQAEEVYQPGRRTIPVSAGNHQQNIFMKTIQWFAGDVSQDPDLSHRRVNYDRYMEPENTAWSVILSNYNRRRPVVISEDFLYLFLCQVWERQQDRQTQNAALSRPYFLKIGYSFPNYIAMERLIRHSVYGRGEGASGFLVASPRSVVRRTKILYPPSRVIYL